MDRQTVRRNVGRAVELTLGINVDGKESSRGGGSYRRSICPLIGRSGTEIQTLPSPWKGLLALKSVAVHSAEGSWIAALYAARLSAVGGRIREILAVRGSGFAEMLPSRRGHSPHLFCSRNFTDISSKKKKKSLLYSLDSK